LICYGISTKYEIEGDKKIFTCEMCQKGDQDKQVIFDKITNENRGAIFVYPEKVA